MPVFKESLLIPEKVSQGVERRIVHLDNLMLVVIDFTDGPMPSPDPPHSHPHEQISYVVEGEINFFMAGEKYHLVKGDMYSVPPEIPHCIQTLSKYARLTDSFYPIRREFISK
jgi:quercetin dioxygenase-like cupin family protein